MADDGFDRFYTERLWSLLPAMYRAADLPEGSDGKGPLRGLIELIGGGIADGRRSIDTLARVGSVETADDWAIPYFADLLATRLVGSMDARAQRLDVARTIAYRRRAGTLALIELLGFDVTGHDARAVEFFRRLGRSRHGYDPGFVGEPALLVGERLIGRASGTPAGGTADLRDAWSATASAGAFDEFAHTSDFRRPGQATGHHAIPRVGVHLWWLYAFPIDGATPVARQGCPNDFSFDPTGRETPLRGAGGRSRGTLGQTWTSPEPWELPLAISNLLWAAEAAHFYPASVAVLLAGGGTPAPAPLADLAIDPERGRFRFPKGAPAGEVLSRYHHGLAGPVGAQGQPDGLPGIPDEPANPATVGGGSFGTALAAPVGARTLLFDDSRTYPGPAGPIAIGAGDTLVLRALSGRRPLIRWTTAATLTFAGGGDARLVLRGLHWQGADLELAGEWSRVAIEQATLDPGSLDAGGAIASAIDGIALRPTRILVSGEVGELVLDHAITGPIMATGAGAIGQLTIRDSIVQAIEPAVAALTIPTGTADILRTTILGRGRVHRLSASDSIFDAVVAIDDPQHGCVRFCTYATGSLLHAPYRSVAIPARSAIFQSRRFGAPGYARLRDDADRAIPAPEPGQSIRSGGETGSETGVFAGERAWLKARSLVVKLEEFMPIGTIPVLIDVG